MAKRKHTSNYWGAIVLEWLQYLQDPDFNSTDYKLLFFLCGKMKNDDNIVYIKQKQIAHDLNMDKGNVSKSIKKLGEKQFIVKCQNGFMINPHLFYVGIRYREGRELLRDNFDILIQESGLSLRFYLNEDEHILELVDNEN